jgi:tight adherence protein C
MRRRWEGEKIHLALIHAGVDRKPTEYLGLRWALIWIGFPLSGWLLIAGKFSFLHTFLAIIVVLSSWWAPPLWLRWRTEARHQELDHSLPDLLDRLQLSLEAGLGFELSLRRAVSHREGLLATELRLTLAMLDRGHTKEEAFDRLVERNPSHDVRAFAAAVKQAEKLGTSLSNRLQVQGELLRARRRRRAEEASQRLPILIVFPLVFFFLPTLLIIYLGPPLLHILLGR